MSTSSSSVVTLSGITWDHTRGLLPMQATAQRFAELHPNVAITWQKRSLQSFADAPLTDLAARFDILVIDHPSIGEAAHHDLLVPLEEHVSPDFLLDQAASSVGASHESYVYNGHQYALAIDAATPVAGWRPDLLGQSDLPRTWENLLEFASRGMVAVPAIPIDSLMNLFMLTNALGAEPFTADDSVIPSRDAGEQALQLLRELVMLSAPGSLHRNPIRTWQFLAASDTVAYCPFAYGYSNYARKHYAQNRLKFGPLISYAGKPLRSTLGGAGLAVSRNCTHTAEAVAYAEFVAKADTQSTIYAYSGGQPGHRAAWQDRELNAFTNNFFQDTLPTLDAAWVRPRFPSFIAFQDVASNRIHQYLREGGSEVNVLNDLDSALRKHKPRGGKS